MSATKLPATVNVLQPNRASSLSLPLPLPPDSLLRITLSKTSIQIVSPVPVRFTVNAIVDQPPLVETKLKGIGTSITRKARIPIAGTILDDYGIASAESFEFRVDDATDWLPRNLAVPPKDKPREFVLQRGEQELFERFDVLPLDLSIKQRLTVKCGGRGHRCTVPCSSGQRSLEAMRNHPAATTAHRAFGIEICVHDHSRGRTAVDVVRSGVEFAKASRTDCGRKQSLAFSERDADSTREIWAEWSDLKARECFS